MLLDVPKFTSSGAVRELANSFWFDPVVDEEVSSRESHEHHEVRETIPGPSAEPTDLPIVKMRANHYWRFQPQELRFKAHTV